MPAEALHRHFNQMQGRTALTLYGRNMYEVMRYWDAPPAQSAEFEKEYARAWQQTPKVVFSTTLASVGPNARLVKEKAEVERTVRQLKAETNGEIEVSGSGLAANLIRLGLVDEFRLYLMPVVLGGGKSRAAPSAEFMGPLRRLIRRKECAEIGSRSWRLLDSTKAPVFRPDYFSAC